MFYFCYNFAFIHLLILQIYLSSFQYSKSLILFHISIKCFGPTMCLLMKLMRQKSLTHDKVPFNVPQEHRQRRSGQSLQQSQAQEA